MKGFWAATGTPEPLAHGPTEWIVRHGSGCIGLIIAAWLIWIGHEHGLGLLAFAEAFLLASGAMSAWLLLAHTANDPVDSLA
jgi:hypothetical protein